FLLSFASSLDCSAQQVADTGYMPPMVEKKKPELKHRVVIDEAHHNFHTSGGRFAPFLRVLRAAGYEVTSGNSSIENSLKHTDILVIANALDERNLSNWSLPTYDAFTREEIE